MTFARDLEPGDVYDVIPATGQWLTVAEVCDAPSGNGALWVKHVEDGTEAGLEDGALIDPGDRVTVKSR